MLRQQVVYCNLNTGANYSCGPTALLFVDNYFFMDMFGQPANYGTDLLLAVRQIGKVYKDLNRSYNTITNTTQLKNVVKNKWQWGTAVKASGNSSISTNLSSMVQRLKQDYPVILALESNYYNNPIPGYAHIVVFYKYDANAKKLYYFDPYYGGTHSVHYNEISSAIQGNLPYLRIAP